MSVLHPEEPDDESSGDVVTTRSARSARRWGSDSALWLWGTRIRIRFVVEVVNRSKASFRFTEQGFDASPSAP